MLDKVISITLASCGSTIDWPHTCGASIAWSRHNTRLNTEAAGQLWYLMVVGTSIRAMVNPSNLSLTDPTYKLKQNMICNISTWHFKTKSLIWNISSDYSYPLDKTHSYSSSSTDCKHGVSYCGCTECCNPLHSQYLCIIHLICGTEKIAQDGVSSNKTELKIGITGLFFLSGQLRIIMILSYTLKQRMRGRHFSRIKKSNLCHHKGALPEKVVSLF